MARTERSGHTTTDHDFIRQWVEERGGWPARVASTGGDDDPGLIRIDFPGFSGEGSLERIEWDQWFEGFEANGLAFLHRDMDHGGGDLDRFNKLISRTGEEDGEGSERGARGRSAVASAARGRGGSSSKKSGSSKTSGSTRGGQEKGGTSRRSTRSSSNGEARETSSGSRARAAAADGGPETELRELLLHELGDLLSAEKLFVQATRALAREAQDPEVKARVEEHVTETERQAERVKEAFAAIGERAKAVKCEAAQGLKEEHDSFKSEEKPSKMLLSAFDLGSGLRVEHYEIAAYRSAIALATALGETECARILKENLDEEVAMASFLEKSSRAVLKRMLTGGEVMAANGATSARKSNGASASKSGRASSAKSAGGSSSRKSGGASSKKSGGSSSGRKSGGSSRKSARA